MVSDEGKKSLSEMMKKKKKPPLGSGKRFKARTGKLSEEKDVENPKALAAWIGRKKYGAKKFNSLSHKN
jgi:hypothetical protein